MWSVKNQYHVPIILENVLFDDLAGLE